MTWDKDWKLLLLWVSVGTILWLHGYTAGRWRGR